MSSFNGLRWLTVFSSCRVGFHKEGLYQPCDVRKCTAKLPISTNNHNPPPLASQPAFSWNNNQDDDALFLTLIMNPGGYEGGCMAVAQSVQGDADAQVLN